MGIKFNRVTCDLYIADAYFGLMVVGPAKQLALQLNLFLLYKCFGIDTTTGAVYLIDSSMYFQRRQYSMLIDSGDRSGRLLRYDTCSKVLTVLQRGLAFPNGVTLNKDKSFLPVAESNSMKILKFWIQGERVTFSPQPFAQLSKFPGLAKLKNMMDICLQGLQCSLSLL